MKQLFLIIGAPGSGKTTDAELIAKNNSEKIAHFSTGDLLRAESAKKTKRGLLIEKFTSQGELVPLEIVVETILSAIKSSDKGIILIDGYPRSVEQMQALDKELSTQNEVVLKSVIEVEVSENTAKERVLERSRGADDNEMVFHNRMRVFLDPLGEIQNFYKNKKVYKAINGERSIEEIVHEMQEYILSFGN
ncbi:adenylate kinase [Helicobacter pylori]|uniref:adenylate kinase n=1 Tax=Helicobacter pylori TaxID=210 RepID=UPI0006AA0EB6|nr:adenylate kinase [Helicobacter pylori]KOO66358.1 adenylate kinase [Helicobacter pylori]OJZ93569.1 adenylate kinase [Helicobacter pylori]OKB28081.1 adenylate kinase [Helicobacter pylori]WRC83337.1 adenylate kinase [Helicobacter pylori]